MRIGLRDAQPTDDAHLLAVYGGAREDELAMTDWDEAQKRAFGELQLRAQDQYQTQPRPWLLIRAASLAE